MLTHGIICRLYNWGVTNCDRDSGEWDKKGIMHRADLRRLLSLTPAPINEVFNSGADRRRTKGQGGRGM